MTLLFVALALGCSDAPAEQDDCPGSTSRSVDGECVKEYCIDEPCVLFAIHQYDSLGGIHLVDLAEPESSTRYDDTARDAAAYPLAIQMTSALDAIVMLREVGDDSHTLYRIELDEPGTEVAIAADFPRGELYRVPNSERMLGRLTPSEAGYYDMYSFVPDPSLTLERLHPTLGVEGHPTGSRGTLQRHEVSADGQTVVVGLDSPREGTSRQVFKLWRSPVDASAPPEKLVLDDGGPRGDARFWRLTDDENPRLGLIRAAREERSLEIGALDDWTNLREVVVTGLEDGQLIGFDWGPSRNEILYLTVDRTPRSETGNASVTSATYVTLLDVETNEPIVDTVQVADRFADCKIFDRADSKIICSAPWNGDSDGTTVMLEPNNPTSTVELLDEELSAFRSFYGYGGPSFAEFGAQGRYLYVATFDSVLKRVDTEPPYEVEELLPTSDQTGRLTRVEFSAGLNWIVYTLRDADDITHLYAARFDELDAPIRLGSGTSEHPDITWSIAGGE